MTIAEWDAVEKWIDLEDISRLRDMLECLIPKMEGEESVIQKYRTVLTKLKNIEGEVLPF